MKIKLLTIAVCLGVGGCSSVIEGTSQEITVNTNPAGANCALIREGAVIARVNPTPAAATIKKTKHDITVECELAGYQKTTFFNKSDVAGATAGNIILGGGIGWAIDSASGADNKYLSPVNITMTPLTSAVPAPAAVPITPASKGKASAVTN